MAKLTRKELLNTPDEFVATTSNTILLIKEHPKEFTVGAIVIVCILLGGYGFYYWKTDREQEGMNTYFRSANNSQMTMQVSQEYSDTMAGKLAKLRLARMAYDQGNMKSAQSNAEDFVNSWSHKDTLYWQAVLILADTYLQQKDISKALPLLDSCIESAPKDLKDQALFLKGGVLIAQGKKLEATKTLSSVSDNYKDISKILLATSNKNPSAKMDAK